MTDDDHIIRYLKDNVSRRNTISRNQRIVENLFSDPSVTDVQRRSIVEYVRTNPHLFTPYVFDDDADGSKASERNGPLCRSGFLEMLRSSLDGGMD